MQVDNTEKLVREYLIDPIVSENAATVLAKRYLAKDDQGNIIEDPKEMYMRVAWAIAAPEKDKVFWATKFYNIMASNLFMPNSPTLMNAGRRLGMLSACFVLPVEDDLNGIFKTINDVALIQRAGGGTGFSFGQLRPNRSIVKSSGGTTAGPLSFIDVFSQATEAIQQGAFRRGANMGILPVDHPDIIDFINAKKDLRRWQNYNVSIAIPNDWMTNITNGNNNNHEVRHPGWGEGCLWKNTETGEVRAFRNSEHPGNLEGPWIFWTIQDTWNLICERAHSTGEPGLFFIDRAEQDNTVPHLGKYEATNPCGEQPLLAYDSCNLGSINLNNMVYKNNEEMRFDWDLFYDVIETAVRFLDNVIEVNNYPIPELEAMSKQTRRIGLGVMGFADMLSQLSIAYDSEAAIGIATRMSIKLQEKASKVSKDLAIEKGPFGAWEGSKFQTESNSKIRNSFLTTVAPTGTISIISDCSGGIEPLFALAFDRQVMPEEGKFVLMKEVNNNVVNAILRSKVFDKRHRDQLIEYIKIHGSLKDFYPVWDNDVAFSITEKVELDKLKAIFKTSHEIKPSDHVRMQAAWQSGIDSAVSKTINLPHDAPVSVVDEVYKQAFQLGCKGITVYRDGCRDNVEGMKQPMKVAKEEVQPEPTKQELSEFSEATRWRFHTQYGTMHLNLVYDSNGNPIELFTQIGKGGELVNADLEAITRLVSLSLSKGATLNDITAQLFGIGSKQPMPGPSGTILSLPDAIAKAIIFYQENYASEKRTFSVKSSDRFDSNYGVRCPSCKVGQLNFQEGCKKCSTCGYSAC